MNHMINVLNNTITTVFLLSYSASVALWTQLSCLVARLVIEALKAILRSAIILIIWMHFDCSYEA